MSIRERLARVRERIEAAALSAGRTPDSVRLIAVSKGQPVEAIREAFEAGQREFGENYVQELTRKAEALSGLALDWHMIGHLQRNKARHVVGSARVVQSVDSVELARELGKRMRALLDERVEHGEQRERLRVFVEVNIAGEAQKGGVSPERLGEVLDSVEAERTLELRGLMCVPPLDASTSASRAPFDALARLRGELGGAARLPELSMGMTQDFELAIAAGATLVRIGTAIFGERAARGA